MQIRKTNYFTLLEIVICIAILGLAAVGIGWQMKGMLAIHSFDKNMGNFFTDLRKAQLVALSDRVDIDLNITKSADGYQYNFHTDDPLLCFIAKPTKLTGIKEIRQGNKKIDKLQLHLYPSGRVVLCKLNFCTLGCSESSRGCDAAKGGCIGDGILPPLAASQPRGFDAAESAKI